MIRKSLAICCAAAAPLAFAQAPAGVTLYGVLDTGIEYVTNVGPTGMGITRMPGNTGSVPSRWGMRGSEDLGNGLRANFNLESGFTPDTGTSGQGGRLFGRQANLGLSGSWGAVTLGRQSTMLFYSMLQSDLLGPNLHGLSALDSYIPNARADNALGYRGTFNGFTVGATYSFGRDAVNAGPNPTGTNCPETAADSKACREVSLLLKYDSANWGVAMASDRLNGGLGAFAGLVSSSLNDTHSFKASKRRDPSSEVCPRSPELLRMM